MFTPFLDSAILIFLYMTIWFFIAFVKKDNSIVDIAWGLGFVIVAWWQYFYYPHEHSLMLTLMLSLWGIRLGVYLFFRNWHTGEDWRYQEMRRNWKGNFLLNSYFKIFLLQGVLMFFIALVIMQPAQENPKELLPFSYFGILFFTIGFLWESIADYQLQQFKSNAANKGKFMKLGLWKYSRHPNYFGEMLVWWGIYLFTIPYGCWYIYILSPALISFLLLRVSGVPFLKKKRAKNPNYEQYIKEVPNALLPKFW